VEVDFAAEWPDTVVMYEADRLDSLLLLALSPSEANRARERHAGEYASAPGLVSFFVAFDASRPPFNDPRVRRAFVLAADRETLAHVVRRAWVSPATGGFVPAGMPAHSPGIALPYDPHQARQLLAQAGYPGGRGFPVVESLAHKGAFEEQFTYLENQWRQNLGVVIRWEYLDFAVVADRQSSNPPHMWWMGWSPDYPDPDNFLRVALSSVRARWRNAAYERLVEEARRLTDQLERMKLYQQADRVLVEEAAIMPVSYNQRHLLVKPWVRRYPGPWKDVIIEPH
jgi:oligopeptide transport system substrate-binding protein